MITSSEIRQSFLDFFKSKSHAIVPSSSLMPDSPNLLFTNAGMNQFVPIFLGQKLCPYPSKRAADTQKCIRAGGKHNDLDDVGMDTYHHTFFEMLGNWSFGDYFKQEAIHWAWELLTERWGFPKERLYATVYCPDKSKGDPSEFDQEAYDAWADIFSKAGLDPKIHIINGNKKDNFWMMGDTGPCGPCSELHIDLTPKGNTQGKLVNAGLGECIEIWNLVFMQFNANPDGTFSELPAKNVDTGMGFERAVSILQCTKNFTDFSGIISNYETDVFKPIFHELEKLSGVKYTSTLPGSAHTGTLMQMKNDVSFRVISDHIRTLSFAIADGILPGNNDRNYVLRRILRRAVRYGRSIGFTKPFFYKLVDVVSDHFGQAFPEVKERKDFIKQTIENEEVAFNKTLDRGISMFEQEVSKLRSSSPSAQPASAVHSVNESTPSASTSVTDREMQSTIQGLGKFRKEIEKVKDIGGNQISGDFAFLLYDTYGFPFDLTELMAREVNLTVDKEGFEKLMEEQRKRARAAQKKVIIEVDTGLDVTTQFIGYDHTCTECHVVSLLKKTSGKNEDFFAAVDISPLYAEMGGQVGDGGLLELPCFNLPLHVIDTVKRGSTFYLKLLPRDCALVGWDKELPENFTSTAKLTLDQPRRSAIERNHTATHLLHWALHTIIGKDVVQKGSAVTPEKFTFDFNSAALTPEQIEQVETLVNERIIENTPVYWQEVPYTEIEKNPHIMQLFGEKYGQTVRVIQIGGISGQLNGYSMELCGGTHVRSTGQIGLFRIISESAVAAGVRRIEAVTGMAAYQKSAHETALIRTLAAKINSPVAEIEHKLDTLVEKQKQLESQIKTLLQKQAVSAASELITQAESIQDIPFILANLGNCESDTLMAIIENLRSRFNGVIVLASVASNGNVGLAAAVSNDFTGRIQAGNIIKTIAPIIGGKGGGKPDFARGGGKSPEKIDKALAKVKEMI